MHAGRKNEHVQKEGTGMGSTCIIAEKEGKGRGW
jgi:hypothetical protein